MATEPELAKIIQVNYMQVLLMLTVIGYDCGHGCPWHHGTRTWLVKLECGDLKNAVTSPATGLDLMPVQQYNYQVKPAY